MTPWTSSCRMIGRRAFRGSTPAARDAPWMRGLRQRVRRLSAALAFLGPGLIAGAAGDDAGGIATYASVGAQYGYDLLWVIGPITVSLVVIQLMIARMGVVTGKGFAELIREVFNVPRYIVVPLMAVAVWLIVVRASYTVAEKIFILLSVALLTYVGAAFLARPDWGHVARSLVTPVFSTEPGFLSTFVAVVGTTITPYMLFYLQSSLSDKGVRIEDYPAERTDVVIGSLLTTIVALFIIVCTAATLHSAGITIETPEHAARALEPLPGPYARVLFGLGLFGASMLAASVLPLSTAYAVCGAFGWERGVSTSWSEAPIFNGLYTALIAFAAAFVLIPSLPLIQVIVATQFLNGLLLPIVLIFMLRLVNDRDLMGRYTNSRMFNVLSYGTTAILIGLTLALLVFSVLGLG